MTAIILVLAVCCFAVDEVRRRRKTWTLKAQLRKANLDFLGASQEAAQLRRELQVANEDRAHLVKSLEKELRAHGSTKLDLQAVSEKLRVTREHFEAKHRGLHRAQL